MEREEQSKKIEAEGQSGAERAVQNNNNITEE